MIVRGYGDPHRVFAFQMFPESSSWQATVYRVTDGGERIDVRRPWPGGYHWPDLVTGRGLDNPHAEQHAAYGVDAILDLLQEALDYVARSTPADTETVRLEADVTYRRNGGSELRTSLVSEEREHAP
jgi:hypothetical protein